ncbi:MAG: hypothetical protein WC965_02135 [Thiohalomonadaceae bacterium]
MNKIANFTLKGFTVPVGHQLVITTHSGETIVKEAGQNSGGPYKLSDVMSGKIDGWELSEVGQPGEEQTSMRDFVEALITTPSQDFSDISFKEILGLDEDLTDEQKTELSAELLDVVTKIAEGAEEEEELEPIEMLRKTKSYSKRYTSPGTLVTLRNMAAINSEEGHALPGKEWKKKLPTVTEVASFFELAERTLTHLPDAKSPSEVIGHTSVSKEALERYGITDVDSLIDFCFNKPLEGRVIKLTPDSAEDPITDEEAASYYEAIQSKVWSPQSVMEEMLDRARSPENIQKVSSIVGKAMIDFANSSDLEEADPPEKVVDDLYRIVTRMLPAKERRESLEAFNAFIKDSFGVEGDTRTLLQTMKDPSRGKLFFSMVLKGINTDPKSAKLLANKLNEVAPSLNIGKSLDKRAETYKRSLASSNLQKFKEMMTKKVLRYTNKDLMNQLDENNPDIGLTLSEEQQTAINFALSLAHPKVASHIMKKLDIQFTQRPRANFRPFADVESMAISVASNTLPRVFAHEVGHLVEYHSWEALRASVLPFLYKRTFGGGEQVFEDDDDDEPEYYRDGGGFIDSYSAKTYPGRNATEVISMGMEMLYKNPAVFAYLDPEHFITTLDISQPVALRKGARYEVPDKAS